MGARSWMWNQMYRREPTWELDQPHPDLIGALDERGIQPGRALDIGCGTGDNAIELARRGFEVTAIDVAERALDRARSKAAAAEVSVDFRLCDITTRSADLDGPFAFVVDRGLLMSLFGERARRAYAAAVLRTAADGAQVFQHQWELPEAPTAPTRAWLATKLKGFVLVPGELERRLGKAFDIEVLRRSIEPSDDPGLRRVGITRVAKSSYWLVRRPYQPPQVSG